MDGKGGAPGPLLTSAVRGHVPCRLHFPQLALRRRLGQLSCMSKPALKLRSWPLTVLYYLLPLGALRPLSRVGWRPVSRVSVRGLPALPPRSRPEGVPSYLGRGGAVGPEPFNRCCWKASWWRGWAGRWPCGLWTGDCKGPSSTACSLCLRFCHVSALFLERTHTGQSENGVCFISCVQAEKSLEVILRRIKFLDARG